MTRFKNSYFELILWVPLLILLGSCGLARPKGSFDPKKTGQAPRYNDSYYWAALPPRADPSDEIPKGVESLVTQDVDVFFIHPTSYIYRGEGKTWNADLLNTRINASTDRGSILYQASIFNESAKIYAPRYRQAIYYSFLSKDSLSRQKALDLAYEDVYNAFLYFFDNFNKNRPIAIVGHSQGALLATRLLKEVFDNEAMKGRLVVAYVPGYPLPANTFKYLKPCESPNQTSCVCSWRTVRKGKIPKWARREEQLIMTNPLSWRTDTVYVPATENLGMYLSKKEGIRKPGVGAQIHKNLLWVDKPKFRGSLLLFSSNYHRGDFNLFYLNVRSNFRQRVSAYWRR